MKSNFPAGLNPNTATGKINLLALEIIEASVGGVRWADLKRELEARLPDLHPKTINGCVWKLVENFPERVEKPEAGLFVAKR